MKSTIKQVTISFALALLTLPALSQVPETIGYQGHPYQ